MNVSVGAEDMARKTMRRVTVTQCGGYPALRALAADFASGTAVSHESSGTISPPSISAQNARSAVRVPGAMTSS